MVDAACEVTNVWLSVMLPRQAPPLRDASDALTTASAN